MILLTVHYDPGPGTRQEKKNREAKPDYTPTLASELSRPFRHRAKLCLRGHVMSPIHPRELAAASNEKGLSTSERRGRERRRFKNESKHGKEKKKISEPTFSYTVFLSIPRIKKKASRAPSKPHIVASCTCLSFPNTCSGRVTQLAKRGIDHPIGRTHSSRILIKLATRCRHRSIEVHLIKKLQGALEVVAAEVKYGLERDT